MIATSQKRGWGRKQTAFINRPNSGGIGYENPEEVYEEINWTWRYSSRNKFIFR